MEVDNLGASNQGGQASQLTQPTHWVWGYDEMSWFSHQREQYRNDWLWYAWRRLKKHAPNGFLQMPVSRIFHDGSPITPGGQIKINWYFVNTQSSECPYEFNQEETIKTIWIKDEQ